MRLVLALATLLHTPAALRPSAVAITRRQAFACSAVALPLTSATAAAPPGADEAARLTNGLALLDGLLAKWGEVTLDCRFGEVKREMMMQENKEQLLQEASSTSKASTTVTMCKTSGATVRRAISGSESPLARIGSLLERPALIGRVDEDKLEDFEAASEKLQQALTAADGAAYLAANDYSAQTTFKRGESTDTPNLDAALYDVGEARKSLAIIVQLVGGGS